MSALYKKDSQAISASQPPNIGVFDKVESAKSSSIFN